MLTRSQFRITDEGGGSGGFVELQDERSIDTDLRQSEDITKPLPVPPPPVKAFDNSRIDKIKEAPPADVSDRTELQITNVEQKGQGIDVKVAFPSGTKESGFYQDFISALFYEVQAFTGNKAKRNFGAGIDIIIQGAVNFDPFKDDIEKFIRTYQASIPANEAGNDFASKLDQVKFYIADATAKGDIVIAGSRTQSAQELINQSKPKPMLEGIVKKAGISILLLILFR